ncbi:MAG: DUF4184 family protein [Moraxellaceae bacterium]
MAFTIAHMAAALPFYRSQKWLNFEALLIGTMLPDLPYFLNSDRAVWQQSHQWLGIFTYCLPWGLLVFVLWHWMLKAAAVALIQPWPTVQLLFSAPSNLIDQTTTGQHSCSKLRQYGYFWLTVVFGLMLGTSTHLLWDGITHPDGFTAQHVNWLQYPLEIAVLGVMPVARLLQYVSSIAALVILVVFVWCRPNTPARKPSNRHTPHVVFTKWQSLIIVTLVGLCSLLYGLYAAVKWQSLLPSDPYLFLAKMLVGLLQGAGGVFILYAVLYCLLSGFNKIER